ncbi:pentapeptide repeat-containing protein [Sporolactobacillus laevolacticus]
MNADDTYLRNITFHHCTGNYASFYGTNMKQVVFDECVLSGSDFSSATLSKINFGQSNIDKAQFLTTKLEGIDLSSCSFQSIAVTVECLSGCIISPEQAAIFAKALGLIVKDPYSEQG